MELELREREKEYISSRDQGDPNFYLTVFTPCVICKSYLVMIIMIEKSKKKYKPVLILTVSKILIKSFLLNFSIDYTRLWLHVLF